MPYNATISTSVAVGALASFFLFFVATSMHAAFLHSRIRVRNALPKDGSGAVYDYVKQSSSTQLDYLFDEYIYEQNFQTHDAAIAAGLKVGFVVYGVPLQVGGNWDQHTIDVWREEYLKTRQERLSYSKSSSSVVKQLNPAIMQVLQNCSPFGLWSRIDRVDACSYRFTVGYKSDSTSGAGPAPIRLVASGGTCDEWSATALSPVGETVTCRRSGDSGLVVGLSVHNKGETSQIQPPPAQSLPPEPKMVRSAGDAQRQTIDTDGENGSMRYGDTKDGHVLFYIDISPNIDAEKRVDPTATVDILSARTTSRSGVCGFWGACPGGTATHNQCETANHGAPGEFTSVASMDVSCLGQSACRMWRLTNGSKNCQEKIEVGFRVWEQKCVNCGDLPFQVAHEQWVEKRGEMIRQQSCVKVADHSEQTIRTWENWFGLASQ